jgi:ATP-dependent Clp protease ATP-binding subunit ClpA
MGARPLSRKIDELIKVPLSKKILFDGLSNCDIAVDMVEGKPVFSVDSKVTALVDHDNIIRLSNETTGPR